MRSSDNSSSEIPVIKDSTIADMEEQRKRAAIRFLTNIPMDLKSFYQMHKERMLEKSDNSMGPKQLTWPKNTSSEKGVFQEGEGPVNNAKSMPPWPQKINQKSAFRIKHLKAKVLLQKRIFIVDKAGNVPLLAYSVLPYKKEGRAIISNAVEHGRETAF
uniref:uncharacterized protein LOC120344377 isoform X1 n=1 Tax=Styela clava TaxID=7725 RepID=UPI00193A7CD0|nr:uncharacterized protein LOC120344377 isoform X1 [Styela clava]